MVGREGAMEKEESRNGKSGWGKRGVWDLVWEAGVDETGCSNHENERDYFAVFVQLLVRGNLHDY